MALLIYNLFVILYQAGIRLVSPWNVKARSWVEGRKSVLNDLRSAVDRHSFDKIVWMHCASLGEFEQGRPVLERIRATYPGCGILLTFFSASGYDVQKNYSGADFVCYLPVDSPSNARQFVAIVRPALVLWVKYEYWYHYLKELKQQDIPLLLVSGIFKKHQLFFKWYGQKYRNILTCFSHLFVQTTESRQLLESIGIRNNITVSGDTRFDRVIEIAEQFQPIGLIEAFCGGRQVVVAGSTWEEDEEVLDHFANSNPAARFIIAPHQVDASHLASIKKLFRHAVLYSELDQAKGSAPRKGALETTPVNVLIIDNIGMLSRLYQYATITYIGGGFGSGGIHNILEAAVYGKPVVFGPEYDRYVEAEELIDCGGGFSIGNALELEKLFRLLLENETEYSRASQASLNYVQAKRGATEKIAGYISEQNLLALS